MKIPKKVQSDMFYYKLGKNIYCKHCKQKRAHFTYIKIKDDIIKFLFNCNCGDDFYFGIDYKKLLDLYYSKQESDEVQSLWDIWCLGSWYNECFKHETDKDDYLKMITRFNRDASGWRGWLNRRKYAN